MDLASSSTKAKRSTLGKAGEAGAGGSSSGIAPGASTLGGEFEAGAQIVARPGAEGTSTSAVRTAVDSSSSTAPASAVRSHAAVSAGDLISGDKHPSTFVGHRGKEIRPVGNINMATVIEGVEYSGHALDQMQHRGIMPSVVKNTITAGIAVRGNTEITVRYYDSYNNVSVIINTKTGKVITVYNGDK